MRPCRLLFLLIVLAFLPSVVLASPSKKKIVLLIGADDSPIVASVLKNLQELPKISERYILEFYTDIEIRNNSIRGDQIKDADIIMGDFMHSEIVSFLARNLPANLTGKKPKIYSLRCAYLADKLKKQGLTLNIQTEKYYSPATRENVRNLILLALSKEGEKVNYGKPFTLPKSGIFHPDAKKIFPDFESYLDWYRKTGKYSPNGFWVGIYTSYVSALKGRDKIEAYMIHALERERINVLPVYGRPPYHKSLKRYFLDQNGLPRVQILVGFSFRFLTGFPKKTQQILRKINAPVFMPLTAYSITINQWKKSHGGISPMRVAWQVCVPEQNGAIEPTMVGGKSTARLKGMTAMVYDTIPMPKNIDFLIRRIKAWHRLQVKPNADKKIAILYWNHPPGKQNIGASYMNLFGSISTILSAMKKNGYKIEGRLPTEEEIKERILLGGRNVGSWAPGELEKLISTGGASRIPISTYNKWFAKLDPHFKEAVIHQWGRPENSHDMIKNGEIIIPWIDLGNVIVLPQPSRGFGEDAIKLYHDPKIYPHHQYIAFYFWLKKVFKVDAIISLGKHGTHEWLPGKQIGLSLSCPPEVLIQDIPNIYPYIVDNLGEGIQAKRRGRGVIIDHLIPPLKKAGSYMEYRELSARIDAYHTAQAVDAALAREKLKNVRKLIRKLGLDRDLGLKELNDNAIEEVEHYIYELQEKLIPYGLHTFGVSPHGEGLNDLTEAICLNSPEIKKEDIKASLKACGKAEIASLLHALNGGYVPAGEGNDPVRNPEAIPTGRNFYGFNVDKVPSKEAFIMGKKLADKMINNYRKKNGSYPDKLGIILWGVETQRNEGVSESAALNLLGITPVWDKKDRVVDVRPIPGWALNRPRIDVLLQVAGLYRDTFGRVIKLLDRAVRMAGLLKDVENFVAIHNQKIEKILLKKGYNKDDAREFSKARVFGPMPGAYVHAMQELVPNSGVWETDKEIADLYIHHYSFAYGDKFWGKSLKSVYKNNLKDVKITMHSRSSNVYNMLDNDDVYACLGGLSLAVKSQRGKYPDVMVANLQDGRHIKLEDLAKSIGKALRTRYLNPKWIQGMKKEGYAGAREMERFVEFMWGWQVTTPFAIDKTKWEQTYEVYVEDKYGMDLKKFFNKANPWAYQSMTARMLEAVRKGYWKADEKVKEKLAAEYALNVIEKGVACCHHTCNNPLLNQMVVQIISLPGVLSPKMVKKFKLAVEQAAGKPLDKQVKDRRELLNNIQKLTPKLSADSSPSNAVSKKDLSPETAKGKKAKAVEGYKMEEIKNKDKTTEVSSSGVQWVLSLFILLVVGLFFYGVRRRR